MGQTECGDERGVDGRRAAKQSGDAQPLALRDWRAWRTIPCMCAPRSQRWGAVGIKRIDFGQ